MIIKLWCRFSINWPLHFYVNRYFFSILNSWNLTILRTSIRGVLKNSSTKSHRKCFTQNAQNIQNQKHNMSYFYHFSLKFWFLICQHISHTSLIKKNGARNCNVRTVIKQTVFPVDTVHEQWHNGSDTLSQHDCLHFQCNE